MKKRLKSEKSTLFILLGILLAVFGLIAVAQGTPIVYENFDTYEPGELDDGSGGSGWGLYGGNWVTSSNDFEEIVNPSNQIQVGIAVTFNGSNKVVEINGESPDGNPSLNNNAIRRQLSTWWSNDVVYVSYLFRAVSGLDTGDFVALWLDDVPGDDLSDHSSGAVFIGVRGNDVGTGTAFARLSKLGNTYGQIDAPTDIVEGKDYLFVAKVFKDNNSNDYNRITFWVNPTLEDVLGSSNMVGTASYENIGLSSFRHVGIRTGKSTERSDKFMFDRIYMATNAIDVMPGPVAGDTFDLPLGELNGMTGGYGFGDNSWFIEPESENQSEIIEPAEPLHYTNASGTINGGNRALEIHGSAWHGNYAVRKLDKEIPDKLFFSFLAQYNGKDSNDFYALWFDSNGATDNFHTEFVPNIGLASGDLYLRLDINTKATLLTDVADGQIVCILGVLEKMPGSAKYNSFKAWVDPGVLIDFDDPDAVVTLEPGNGLTSINYIGVRMGTNTEFADTLLLDRLALGTTLDSVVPISMEKPEPLGGTIILLR